MKAKAKILIVEDQEGFRKVYQTLLSEEGYEVSLAEDGEKGLQFALEERPDLVILDLGLPGIDGYEVLRSLRADLRTRQMPVLIFSILAEVHNIKKAMAMGANDYVVKGFTTPRQILSKIKDLLNNQPLKASIHAIQIPLPVDPAQASGLQDEVGLEKGLYCPLCRVPMALQLFPDHANENGHWFTARVYCSHCQKAG